MLQIINYQKWSLDQIFKWNESRIQSCQKILGSRKKALVVQDILQIYSELLKSG